MSFPRPDMPHIASQLQRTGSCYRRSSQQRGTGLCAPAATRGQMAAGTWGTRNAKKGEVEELKPAQGLNFCPLSKRHAQRGETHLRLRCERFPWRLRSLPVYNGARPTPTDCWLPYTHFQLSVHQPDAGHKEMPLLHSQSCSSFVATYLVRARFLTCDMLVRDASSPKRQGYTQSPTYPFLK